jgi:MoaA/NifB/PqqE/SkfB family radical SAM enzyme
MNSSSLIEEEFVKHGWAPLEKRTEDDVYELDIGYLEELALVGGEPTVNKKFYDILDYFIDNGRAKNMHLNYTTNCTSFNNPWIDRVKQFKSIHINLSIDAAGETYEYIRNGAEWNKVEKNIHKIIDFVSNHSKESDYNIQMVAMVYNFAVIEKWFEYFLQFDPDVINICPVQGPYGLEIIPPHIKTQKINFLKQYYPHPLAHKAVNFFFKNIEFNSQIATTYKTYNDWLDSIRATSLYKLDPIFEDILAKV